MTNTGLVVYDPLLEITTFSGKKYYIKEKNRQGLENDMETKKFIKIRDSLINVSSIDTVDPANQETNQIENKLINIPKESAEKIRKVISERKKEGLPITDGVIENIIEKFNS